MPTKQEMLDYIGQSFGRMGVGTIKMGSTLIECPEPESLPMIEGFGDTIRLGDVFVYENNPEPHRLLAVYPEDGAFGILSRELFEGPCLEKTQGPTSSVTNGTTWRARYKKLTAKDVSDWFWSRPKLRDGWHSLPHWYGEVEIKNGKPIRIKRHPQKGINANNIKLVAELAGRVTGTVVKVGPRYADPAKLIKDVISCETMPMPEVP